MTTMLTIILSPGTIMQMVFVALVVGYVIYYVVRRCFFESDRDSKTIPATFLRYNSSVVNPSVTDRARMNSGMSSVTFEHNVLFFYNEETGKEMRFDVQAGGNFDWEPNQKGMLTYSGKRFISFQKV